MSFLDRVRRFTGVVDRIEENTVVIIVDDSQGHFQLNINQNLLKLEEELKGGEIISFGLKKGVVSNAEIEKELTEEALKSANSLLESLRKGEGSSFKV